MLFINIIYIITINNDKLLLCVVNNIMLQINHITDHIKLYVLMNKVHIFPQLRGYVNRKRSNFRGGESV